MSSLQMSCCGGICGLGWGAGIATQHRYMMPEEEKYFWGYVPNELAANDYYYKLSSGGPGREELPRFHPDCLTSTGWWSFLFWNQAVRYTNHPYKKWGGLTTGNTEVAESQNYGGHEYLEMAPEGSEHARDEDKEWVYNLGATNSPGQKRKQVEYNPWQYFDEYEWVTAQLKYNQFRPARPWTITSRENRFARYTGADGVHIEQKQPSCNRTKDNGAIIAKDVVLGSKWLPYDDDFTMPVPLLSGWSGIEYHIHGVWQEDTWRPSAGSAYGSKHISYTLEQAKELFRGAAAWYGWDWRTNIGSAYFHWCSEVQGNRHYLFNGLSFNQSRPTRRPQWFFAETGPGDPGSSSLHPDKEQKPITMVARKKNDYRTSRLWLGPWVNTATGRYGSSAYDDSNLGGLRYYDYEFYLPYYKNDYLIELDPQGMVSNFPGPTRTIHFDFVQPSKGYRDVSDLGLEDDLGAMIELLDRDVDNLESTSSLKYRGVWEWDSEDKKVVGPLDTTNGDSGSSIEAYPYVVHDTEKYDIEGLEGRRKDSSYPGYGPYIRGDDLYSPLKRVGSVVGLSVDDGHSYSAQGAHLVLNTIMGADHTHRWEDKPDWYSGGCWDPDNADWLEQGGLPWEDSTGAARKGEWRIGNNTYYPCSWIWGLENWSEETSNCVYNFSVECTRMYHGYCKVDELTVRAEDERTIRFGGYSTGAEQYQKQIIMPVTDWFVVKPRIEGEIGKFHGIATPEKRFYYSSHLVIFPESKWEDVQTNNFSGDGSFKGFGIAGGAPNPTNTTGCNLSLLVNQETWCQVEEHFEVRKPTLTTGGEYDHDDYTVVDRFSSTYLVPPFQVVSKDQSNGRPFQSLFNKIKEEGGTGTDVPWPTIKNIQINKPTTIKI